MINIIKKEIDVEESLRKRLEIICDFCNTTPTIINGSIRKVDKTNDEYKNIQTLSITINNVDKGIQGNQKAIKTLTENKNNEKNIWTLQRFSKNHGYEIDKDDFEMEKYQLRTLTISIIYIITSL